MGINGEKIHDELGEISIAAKALRERMNRVVDSIYGDPLKGTEMTDELCEHRALSDAQDLVWSAQSILRNVNAARHRTLQLRLQDAINEVNGLRMECRRVDIDGKVY